MRLSSSSARKPFAQVLTSFLGALAVMVATLTASTREAHASDDALFKFMLGATAIAIIAGTASHAQQRGHVRSHVHVPARSQPQYCGKTVRNSRGQRHTSYVHCPAPRSHAPKTHHRSAVLPNRCLTGYSYRGQRHRGYSGACLHNAGYARLPGACVVSSRGGNLYSAQCLYQRGYRRG